ncbi:PHD domain-containing protein [Cryptosporidium canis]|uniref:PHD domain-containing protein n=1 Tax=Cryptosporidium canis TaxID=195482 RepID=A0A9D5HV65_9CRYT|nr:PHD domain-containing protein [Cryptosporidium canis]
MFSDSGKVTRGRGSSGRDLLSGGGVPSDDDNAFWMGVESEYFGKVDDRMRDILKFHIQSSQYMLSIIRDSLSIREESDWREYASASMTVAGGLRVWERNPGDAYGGGFGFFENWLEQQSTGEGSLQDSVKEEPGGGRVTEVDDREVSMSGERRVRSIRLTLSVPPLSRPVDFPRELMHSKSLKEILHNLVKIQCAYRYTRLNSSRSLYSILDMDEGGGGACDRSLSGTCNYVCLLPDVITGPNVEWCSEKRESDNSRQVFQGDDHYYFNDLSDEWIFNINNRVENMELRRSLLDTSHLLPFNHYKASGELRSRMVNDELTTKINDGKTSDGCISKSERNNRIKSILGAGEGYFRMDPKDLVPVVELGGEDTTVSRIKRAKSFGDFFQGNLHISPSRPLDAVGDFQTDGSGAVGTDRSRYLNLSSIMNSDGRIDFEQVGQMYGGGHLMAGIYGPGPTDLGQRYLNRQSERELREVSVSLVRRLEEISKSKLEIFQRILSRVEEERQPNPGYWYKKECELNDYYRRKQYDVGYNYTLERQARDLEKFRLACIESKYLPNEWQEIALCSICGNDTDWDEDPIYFCDGCYQPAHHSCVNPKQPFRYNSTRMLNVLERERKCQQGELDSSCPKKKEGEVDEDDQWLCDACLNIKGQLLDHQHLFFGLIRMISGPRDHEVVEAAVQSIRGNVSPFLGQLMAYNVISSSIRDMSTSDPIIFPWIKDWIFPVVTQDDPESPPEEESNKVVITERRKGRPRKTPLLSLTTINRSSFRFFTFNFQNVRRRDLREQAGPAADPERDSAVSNHDPLSQHDLDQYEWTPTCQTPYNFANLEVFKAQIFNPVGWHRQQEAIRRANQTPPPTTISPADAVWDGYHGGQAEAWPGPREASFGGAPSSSVDGVLEIFRHDQTIIGELEKKGVIRYDPQNSSCRVRVKVPICQLCGYDAYCRSGGIMKKTVDGFWAHIRCALGNSSVLSSDGNYLRIKVDLQRNKIKCEGCGKVDSSPILCHNSQCCISYHINCASSTRACIVDWENSRPLLYCPEHSCSIAPTILLRRYQLSHFNRWYYQRFETQQSATSIFGNIFTLPSIVRQTFLADLRDDTRTLIFLTRLLSRSAAPHGPGASSGEAGRAGGEQTLCCPGCGLLGQAS